jgi:2'-5' RNA ligase
VRLALWLIPDELVRARAAALIDALARELGRPAFPPHVTLLAGLRDAESDVVERARTLARELRPMRAALGALHHGPEYFRAVFVEVSAAELPEVHRRAARALDAAPDPAFAPHLSLLYGEVARETREAAVERAGRRWDLSCALARLDVVDTEGPVEAWTTRARLILGPAV